MDLKDLQALREGWDFEAKKAAGRDGRGAVPASFWETYSAMANSKGGTVVLGVREKADHSLRVQGITDPDAVERELWNLLQNRQKTSVNLLREEDVTREVIDGKAVLVIRVPRARREERPVYINDDLFGGTFIRVHEGDRRADKDRVRRMIAEAELDVRDRKVLPSFGMGDLDRESLRAFRQIFRDTSPDHPRVALDDREFLEQLGGWGLDRESGREGLTAAGLLMLGTSKTITEAFPYYFVDYQEREAKAETIEWIDRVIPDGSWSGNLFDFYRRTVRKLVADLKVPFRLDSDMIRRDDTHVHEALREALVNTLIHADYEGRASVLVVKRPQGFELRNPGTLRLPVEQIRRGGFSDCRNRTLQLMFRAIGLGEQTGAGFSRIRRAWLEQQWPEPSIDEDVELDCVTLRLSLGSIPQSSPQSAESSTQSSPQSAASSTHKPANIPQSMPQNGESIPQSIPQSMPQRSSAPVELRSAQDVRAAISSLCRQDYRTIPEIAARLNRAPRTIRENYVKPMVVEGLLEPLHPDKPRHPQQAYRSVPQGGNP